MTDRDSMLLLPPDARAELSAQPLTDTERRRHERSPLGAAAGWYYASTGSGLLALALHHLSGLPLVALLVTVGDAGDVALGDRPLELMLEAGVWCDGRLLGAGGTRTAPRDGERVVTVGAERVRDFCAEIGSPAPSDPRVAAAAYAAAHILLTHIGRLAA
jgi:hypothetical protein